MATKVRWLLLLSLLTLFFAVIIRGLLLYYLYDFSADNYTLADLYGAGGSGLSPPLLNPARVEGPGVLDLPGGRTGAGHFSLLASIQPEDLSFRDGIGNILTALSYLSLALGRI